MPEKPKLFVWEPLTPRGVAGFAGGSLGRLLLVQSICALLLAATVLWFLSAAWFPVIGAALRRLPDRGEIRSGKLHWHGRSPELLADNRFLALTVDLSHSGEIRSPAHVQVEFGDASLLVFSLAGYAEVPYPTGWIVSLTRAEAVPWWGAWKPAILAIAVAIVLISSLLLWTALATIYFLPVWLVGFFANRELNLRRCWKLAGAALMPGALLSAFAILLYTWGALDLIRLAAVGCLNVVIGWVYLVVSPLFLPRPTNEEKAKGNPFATPPAAPQK